MGKDRRMVGAQGQARRGAAVFAVLLGAALLAYAPSLRGGFIWDDPDYVINNPTLRDASGLLAMWTDRHSLPQWYPMVHTTFWLEHQLWGLWPGGYRIVNLLLHVASAWLLWIALRRLGVPGALLAAGVFALHPVHVESVAWITERKNTLSTFFYLAAFLAYLRAMGRWDHADWSAEKPMNWRWYAAALGLFVLALLSKTVTCSLPAAILLVIWWKRGRVAWRDVTRLIAFLVIGLLLALNTAWLERQRVGAFGPEWQYAPTPALEPIARTLIAGRAVWFYASKLIAPVNLAFIYERWSIDVLAWWQYLYPLALLGLIVALWLSRRRIGRGPLVVALLFVGTLVPALGYFNVYPHRYSFVADHFQYLASIAPIALVAAVLHRLTLSWTGRRRLMGGLAILLILGGLAFRQSFIYRDSMTLWSDTVARSPGAWMAWLNLGHQHMERGELEQAERVYQRALDLAPGIADTWVNIGAIRGMRGDYLQAEDALRQALRLNPTMVVAHDMLAQALQAQGRGEQAEHHLRQAIAGVRPMPESEVRLAMLLENRGDLEQAITHYTRAIHFSSRDPLAHARLALLLLKRQDFAQAQRHLERLVELEPGNALAWMNLGIARLGAGQRNSARVAFTRALQLDPGLEPARQALDMLR